MIRSVLAVGAHPDDIELGCGGSLAKLAYQGVRVRAIVLSNGDRGARADRCEETRKALGMLGVLDVAVASFPDTRLAEHLPELIALLERHCREVDPQRVYTMFKDDRHQDHRAVYEATIVACRCIPQILSYETPSSWPNFMPVVFEQIDSFVDAKMKAISMHGSQQHRSYMQPSQVACNLQFRGHQVGLGYCEGFIPYKLVL